MSRLRRGRTSHTELSVLSSEGRDRLLQKEQTENRASHSILLSDFLKGRGGACGGACVLVAIGPGLPGSYMCVGWGYHTQVAAPVN